ncbi:MAG: glycosyltransferase family 8 protein [Oscillospiraceae bacterium]|nr:glycosyltransferase family 8 protein [Oscillospiraceae bacterium]
MTNKTIPIFFSIDDSYAPFLSVALKSAIDNSKSENNYRAIVMFESLSQDNRERLGGLATDNFKIDFVEMNEGLETITDRLSNRIRSEYFTLTIYFRLFIASMFPEYDKAIYIDSDIILEEDIAELFSIDIGDNFIGACRDASIDGIEPFQSYVEQVVGVDRNDYVNSGVLLMNLKRLRDADFDKHFLFLLNTYHFDSVAPDQDYLNAICKGSIYYLSPKWNAMPNEQKPKIEGAKLIHYNLFSKPWCYDGLQYGERFWHYAENSGYINEIREFKNNFTEDNQKEEMEILGNMLRRAEEIKGHDITLKKVGESGVKVRL